MDRPIVCSRNNNNKCRKRNSFLDLRSPQHSTYTKSMTAQMAGVAGAGDSGAAAASGGVDAFDGGAAVSGAADSGAADSGAAAAATAGGAGRAYAATDPGSTPIIYR